MNDLQNKVLAVGGTLLILNALFPPRLPTDLTPDGGRSWISVHEVSVPIGERMFNTRRLDVDVAKLLLWGWLIIGATSLLMGIVGDTEEKNVSGKKPAVPEPPIDPDAEPYVEEGVAWNPIQGQNRFLPGQGLNSALERKRERD